MGQAYGGSQDYTNTLPSLNVRLKWNDQLQFRFAASKGIVRPEMAWLSPYTSLGYGFTTYQVGAAADATFGVSYAPGSEPKYTGTGGNPNLKPIEANQYDLTAEWYFAPTGSVTVDLFKKDLTNYIYNVGVADCAGDPSRRLGQCGQGREENEKGADQKTSSGPVHLTSSLYRVFET